MQRSELDYHLPPERIAQTPAEPRDSSRLMVLHRASGAIEHRVFRDLVDYLRAGDCLVLNTTRVIPARFYCRRESGGRVEAFFLRTDGDQRWQALLRPSGRLRVGERLTVSDGAAIELVEKGERGQWVVRPTDACEPEQFLRRFGQTPLPPYLRRADAPEPGDAARYQTVFAEQPGAVAAPTAGLHFTADLLERLAARGVCVAKMTLHVGVGTFAPIEVENLADHTMHSEWFSASAEALNSVAQCRAAGGRVVAVGSTATRTLETIARRVGGDRTSLASNDADAVSGWTDLLIYPPYEFRWVDAMITNFHLPGSTLLALVMAFAGVETAKRAYAEAIGREYRFFSYGDAMLIV